MSAVRPSLSPASTSAPLASSSSTLRCEPPKAAPINAVEPLAVAAFTSTPPAHQRFHGLAVVGRRGRHEDRHALAVLRVHVGAGSDQQADHVRVSLTRGQRQRRHSTFVLRVRGGARVQQDYGGRGVPGESRRATGPYGRRCQPYGWRPARPSAATPPLRCGRRRRRASAGSRPRMSAPSAAAPAASSSSAIAACPRAAA